MVGSGRPILSFSPPSHDGEEAGPALFGPVIDAPPSGEDSLRLWDAIETISRWGGFAELMRNVRSFPETAMSAKLAKTDTYVR